MLFFLIKPSIVLSMNLPDKRYLERVCTFGKSDALIGIFTQPLDLEVGNPSPPVVLLLNSGFLHRVGPGRLYVELARKLAEYGISSFRIDLPGIGDSELETRIKKATDSAIAACEAAMNKIVQLTGLNRFIPAGICYGADIAHRIALKDDRVAGAVFMDGYRYSNTRYYLRRYGPSVVNPAKVAGFIQKRLTATEENLIQEDREDNPVSIDFHMSYPTKEQMEQDLQNFADRNINMLFVYTSNVLEYFNTREFAGNFTNVSFRGLLQVKRFENANHTFILKSERKKVISYISGWITENY